LEKYRIELAIKAKTDYKNIVSYIRNKLLEPSIADKYAILINESINNLQYSPEKFAIIDSDLIKSKTYRKMVVKNYIVIYRIENDIVHVVRIVYGGMNWESFL
jgi:addiction module RelE/StbE family toxin